MKHALMMVFVAVLAFSCLAATSYGGSDELMQLVQSSDFWSTYQWGRPVKESKLYKSTKWRVRKTDKDDQNYYYDSDIELTVQSTQMTISVNKRSKMISGYHITLGGIEYRDYVNLLSWSVLQYGKPVVYTEHKKMPGEGVFSEYLEKKSSWVIGNTVISLVLLADTALKPLVVDMDFSDRRAVKLDKPTTTIVCKNMTMTSTPDQQFLTKKMNDITMILDENSNRVFDGNLEPTDMAFTVTETLYKIERRSEIGSLLYLINRLNGKLEGQIKSYDMLSLVSGECEKVDLSARKF